MARGCFLRSVFRILPYELSRKLYSGAAMKKCILNIYARIYEYKLLHQSTQEITTRVQQILSMVTTIEDIRAVEKSAFTPMNYIKYVWWMHTLHTPFTRAMQLYSPEHLRKFNFLKSTGYIRGSASAIYSDKFYSIFKQECQRWYLENYPERFMEHSL